MKGGQRNRQPHSAESRLQVTATLIHVFHLSAAWHRYRATLAFASRPEQEEGRQFGMNKSADRWRVYRPWSKQACGPRSEDQTAQSVTSKGEELWILCLLEACKLPKFAWTTDKTCVDRCEAATSCISPRKF